MGTRGEVDSRERLRSQIFEAVEAEAQGLEATLTEDPKTELVRLEPLVPGRAAPVEFGFDTPQQVSCFPGIHEMNFEFWSVNFEENLDGVRALARAVLEGTYWERVRKGGNPTYPKIVASYPESDGVRRESALNCLRLPFIRRNWTFQHYDGYDRATA